IAKDLATSSERTSMVPELLKLRANYTGATAGANATAIWLAHDNITKLQDKSVRNDAQVASLTQQLNAAQNLNNSINEQLKMAQEQVNPNKKNFDDAVASANKTTDDFKNQLTQANAQMADLRGQLESQLKKDQDELDAVRKDAEQDRRDKVLQMDQLK